MVEAAEETLYFKECITKIGAELAASKRNTATHSCSIEHNISKVAGGPMFVVSYSSSIGVDVVLRDIMRGSVALSVLVYTYHLTTYLIFAPSFI